ncbi:MAG: N-acetylmuramoyl-L-alanine amidase [Bacteroidales bacterium]|nr:N-acetylmuramoyl-L-alanine amidase [Bacteroidales bacterium]
MIYIIQSLIGLGISWLLYRLFLKKEKYFKINRYYLLGAVIICSIAPLISINIQHSITLIPEMNVNEFLSGSIQEESFLEATTVETIDNHAIKLSQWMIYFYLFVAIILLIRFICNLLLIIRLLKNKGPKVNGMQVINVNHKTNPYSFFKYLFINKDSLNGQTLTNSLMEHEKAHSQQLHSLDILFMELAGIVLWFNPFIWLIKKEITENHEFLADAKVIQSGQHPDEYASTIIHSIKNTCSLAMTSNFSFLQTKKRLIMINKKKSSILKSALKITFLLLLMTASLLFFSFKNNNSPFIIVIDPGHGGKDPGTEYNEIKEKDLNLLICQKLKDLNNDKDIQMLFTRSDDKYITLEDRVKFATDNNADFFISVHYNSSQNENQKGIEAYYYGDGQYTEQSYESGKTMIEELGEGGRLKTANFLVLKNAECPGILLLLGFLSNSEDRAKLQEDNYVEEMASSIYKSILKIGKMD